jgi:hypothetical protein
MTPIASPADLMADPIHLLKWLRILPPNHVCADDMLSSDHCLGTRFLRAHGHADAHVIFSHGIVMDENERITDRFTVARPIYRALYELAEVDRTKLKPITADLALKTLRRQIRLAKEQADGTIWLRSIRTAVTGRPR